eukprot:COSAG02_NODE_3811_length_6194_cov_2.390320_2_plen_228_part_00
MKEYEVETAEKLVFAGSCWWELPAALSCDCEIDRSVATDEKSEEGGNGNAGGHQCHVCTLCQHLVALNKSCYGPRCHVEPNTIPAWISMLPFESKFYREKGLTSTGNEREAVSNTQDRVQQVEGGLTSYDIFISYRWLPDHKPVARALFEWFNCHTKDGAPVTDDTPEKDRIRVFWDAECMPDGEEPLADKFIRAAGAAKVFVILVSPEVLTSIALDPQLHCIFPHS